MPRYQFDIRDGSAPSQWVTELADLKEARLEASRFIGELLIKKGDDFWVRNEWALEVSDGQGLNLFVLAVIATDSPSIFQRKGP